ncbi:MAG: Uma2 family endonuclease [Prochlorothrix sp.]
MITTVSAPPTSAPPASPAPPVTAESPASTAPAPRDRTCLSTEQYLAQERHADHKSELINGVLFPMAGASANHNRIVTNLSRLLPLETDRAIFDLFIGDMRLGLPDRPTYTYPDILVVRGTPQFQSESETEVLNPCLIVEVLSKSTSDYDKDDKFRLYKTIPSLEEYILVSQTEYAVSQYIKQDDRRWLIQDWIGLDATLELPAVGVSLALADLYKRVTLEPVATPSEAPFAAPSEAPSDKNA